MKKIIYILIGILLVSVVTAIGLTNQQQLDNIDLSNENLNTHWLQDSKGNKKITVEGNRCIFYINQTVITKEYEQITIEGIGTGDGNWTGNYINETITEEVWIDCNDLNKGTKEQIDRVLDKKINYQIKKGRSNIVELQTKQDIILIGVNI